MTREATVMMMAMVLGQSKTPRLGIRIVIWILSPSYVFQIGRMLCYQTLLRSALHYVRAVIQLLSFSFLHWFLAVHLKYIKGCVTLMLK